jgi:uncharacterized protein with ParB-like and HNH nuclease domain
MEARFKRIRDLFGKSGAKFRVPEYQRGFEWDEKNFEDLWADLKRVGEGVDIHYLGNIIILEEGDSTTLRYSIVDGQQRMVTISILMMAIRDAQTLNNQEDRIIDEVLNTYPTGGAERRLELYNDDQDNYFEDLWRGDTSDIGGNVGEAYGFYRQKLTDYGDSEIENIKTKVVNNLRIVETTSNDNSLAYMVFQSQNERGKEVEPQILAKARVFGEAEKTDDTTAQRETKGRWQEIYRGTV